MRGWLFSFFMTFFRCLFSVVAAAAGLCCPLSPVTLHGWARLLLSCAALHTAAWYVPGTQTFPRGPVETEAHAHTHTPPVCLLIDSPPYVALEATVLPGTKPLKQYSG
jgi:hypothetical protein